MIQNNELTIKETLDSLSSLNAQIIVGDIGSTDQTASICRKQGIKVTKIDCKQNRSSARNQLAALSESDWNLHLEPWETIIRGHEELEKLTIPGTFRCNVIQKTIITKPIRIWHKDKKIN